MMDASKYHVGYYPPPVEPAMCMNGRRRTH